MNVVREKYGDEITWRIGLEALGYPPNLAHTFAEREIVLQAIRQHLGEVHHASKP